MLEKSLWEGDAGKGQNQRKQSEQANKSVEGQEGFQKHPARFGKNRKDPEQLEENMRKDRMFERGRKQVLLIGVWPALEPV